ncbi:MAG: anthranilate phosphoribosyltransferase [Balneolaceae bacterium]|nr:MAG: anthranilate phosphoribosyltransferase [Balneolaceae bacterium]
MIEKISKPNDLTSEESVFAIQNILSGAVSAEEIAAFLMGYRMKGQTTEELTAFVREMRKAALNVEVDTANAVDLCGTGGDKSGTFNISTTAMFVAAGAGVPVLKHGNRSISSRSGSYDVLRYLGAYPDLNKTQVELLFRETGMAFMFAPNFHPALKYVMPVRRALKVRTFFNMLGPLLNPAGVRRQIIGTFSKEASVKMIQILRNLDTEHVFTFYSEDGLDEISTSAGTHLNEFEHSTGDVTSKRFQPEDLGFSRSSLKQLAGGEAEENAGIMLDILSNRATDAQRDVVLLNAAFAILVSGLAGSLQEGKERAIKSIDSGEAKRKLDLFISETKRIVSLV